MQLRTLLISFIFLHTASSQFPVTDFDLNADDIKDCKANISKPWRITSDKTMNRVELLCNVPHTEPACIVVAPGTKVKITGSKLTSLEDGAGCIHLDNGTLITSMFAIEKCSQFTIKGVNSSVVWVMFSSIMHSDSPDLGVINVEDSFLKIESSKLINNKGPSLYIKKSMADVASSTVNGNNNYNGGTFMIKDSKVDFSSVEMVDNKSKDNGCLCVQNSAVKMNGMSMSKWSSVSFIDSSSKEFNIKKEKFQCYVYDSLNYYFKYYLNYLNNVNDDK